MRRKKTPRTREQRLADLTALLQRPGASWRHVTSEIGWWPAEDQEQAVALIEAHADRWPPRARDLSPLACTQLSDGQVQPYHRLIGRLDMGLLWRYRRTPELLSRLIHEAGLRRLASFTSRYSEGRPLLDLLFQHVTGLEDLSLGSSGLHDADALALAQAPSLAGLQSLSLNSNHVTDEGARALVASPHLRDLGYLNLYGNGLSRAGVELIEGAPQWARAHLVLHQQRPA